MVSDPVNARGVATPSTPRTVRSAAVLLIGNELLSGKTQDQNLAPLATTLRGLGIPIHRVVVLADEIGSLAREIRSLSETYDVVFTSGGVGPTHDDVTVDAVATAFGVSVCQSLELESLLRDVYGDNCEPAHLRMARVPEGSELLAGTDLKWPSVMMRNVWLLPGIPELFRMKIVAIREHLRGERRIFERVLFLRLDELDAKSFLDTVVLEHSGVEVGSYPKWFDEQYRTKVTFDGESEQAVEAACAQLEALLPPGSSFRSV